MSAPAVPASFRPASWQGRPVRQATLAGQPWWARVGLLAALVLAAGLLGGCASWWSGSGNTKARQAVAGKIAGQKPAAAPDLLAADILPADEPRYLRFHPAETGLIAVFDNGHDTFLEFDRPQTADLTLHDVDGRQLAHVVAGAVVATPSLHPGLLVLVGEKASFTTLNPRRSRDVGQALPGRPDFAAAAERLGSRTDLRAAVRQALEAPGPLLFGEPAPLTARASQARQRVLSRLGAVAASRPAIVERGPAGRLAPLSAVDLSTEQIERGLVRVYFASGSRAIVAPDDGLGVLLRAAPRADLIRITGFADALGAKADNLELARSRADAVAQILLRRGVDPLRIEVDARVDGFVAGNDTEPGRAMNRRAEVQLLRDGRPLNLAVIR